VAAQSQQTAAAPVNSDPVPVPEPVTPEPAPVAAAAGAPGKSKAITIYSDLPLGITLTEDVAPNPAPVWRCISWWRVIFVWTMWWLSPRAPR